ncbi:uncharacterized protein LOC106132143 [Amyelois transitella]|uniref:uncharacterized protein LOC106132143 n=1 Tax=Amyelois transitella TaxID=680683 RepID=UPI00298FBDBB|nr:uncharacterized protein LOC106132143 [Amyelois transitella]
MCEIQDYFIEQKDIYWNKYSMCSEMDLYITDSLQDMLDMDIKNEIATDLSSITDFSDSLGLNFAEMPPLLDMDTDNSSTWLNNTSSFVHNLDLYGSEANAVMVNPNSVMPSSFAETPVKSIVKEEASNLLLTSAINTDLNSITSLPSPKEEKSHLTFSPNTIKVPKAEIKTEPEEPAPKKLEEATQMVIYVRKQEKNVVKDLLKDLEKTKMNTTTPTTVRIKASQAEVLKVNNKSCSILNSSQKITQQIGAKTIISGNIHILDAQQSRTILANSNKSQATTILIDNSSLNNNKQIFKTSSVSGAFTVDTSQAKYVSSNNNKSSTGEFPKPAYSYSCLIAMALKNSRTGSLPVSEIYNFMCQHFPYFKTAPNGWKNSVRHNLSLNKCFEKIEKPSTNGSQRKGCLWAMNPSKVGKMDEEVQKWSRKDPQAIKKAMVYPESLEALERGEMKYSGVGGDTDPDDDADVDADAELDADVEIDPEVKEVEEEDAVIEQEVSDQELEVEEVVEGTGMVGGTYRLLATGPSSLSTYITDVESGDEVSDVEILDRSYEDSDYDMGKPMKLDLSVTENYTIHTPKRAKTSFIYQPVTTQTHTSRRKTPLVNRVALI